MTDDQYEKLRQLLLNQAVEIEALKLMLRQQNELAEHRFQLLYEWCAPVRHKAGMDEDATPADIRKLFGL